MQKENFMLREGFARLSAHVKIREEYFGGIVFHKDSGDTLEVDQEAYQLLAWLREVGIADLHTLAEQEQARTILPVLFGMNIIEYLPEVLATYDRSFKPVQKPVAGFTKPLCWTEQVLSAPETVHLAITYRCGENCPDCYSQKYTSFAKHELGTTELNKIIDDVADSGVFQLAIGGGEPFVRRDLHDILCHAARKSLVVHLTTGQYVLKPQWLDMLANIKSLHIGIRSEGLISRAERTADELKGLAEYLKLAGISLGANIILTRFAIHNIERLFELLVECGFKRLIFLRYKPIADQNRWHKENPNAGELISFRNWLKQTKYRFPDMMLRIDCASAFLLKDMEPPAALRAGIKGCVAAERIIFIAPDGSVYPCSQLVGKTCSAGNAASGSFKSIWQENTVLNNYRQFRQNEAFTKGCCGKCAANRFCGGCRVFAQDAVGSEPFCPLKQK